ncbi:MULTISPECIES: hypothetical protein [Rhodobacterales]|uniref:hypothetical protein n=1 Tax=Rhodobacterales TaxID=204455 RepID=UPI00237F7E61|nr:hypothetical protein [Phaeobacter gallaeciensis]MDE4098969.1 hypothetical protein [Phaeobacter gallaeciensis]MDE4107779.1 hypothetical protein [Phaeobacter gallaeciensis]MDE4112233.1 hypothetical protein [Phaeobacter gallaeciensis]MDE4116705.1 hypothetical protein [Phaeobacter gallaeciensis]MDE4121175.1 hypothetical protein [Phaeobacter gallaeciensis]
MKRADLSAVTNAHDPKMWANYCPGNRLEARICAKTVLGVVVPAEDIFCPPVRVCDALMAEVPELDRERILELAFDGLLEDLSFFFCDWNSLGAFCDGHRAGRNQEGHGDEAGKPFHETSPLKFIVNILAIMDVAAARCKAARYEKNTAGSGFATRASADRGQARLHMVAPVTSLLRTLRAAAGVAARLFPGVCHG